MEVREDRAGTGLEGLTLELVGDSNDYLEKGCPGKLDHPPTGVNFKQQDENIIIGNVALYGQIQRKGIYQRCDGERLASEIQGRRGSEGVGDHGCEHMTGGRAVVLGQIGKNFAAGMSGRRGVCSR